MAQVGKVISRLKKITVLLIVSTSLFAFKRATQNLTPAQKQQVEQNHRLAKSHCNNKKKPDEDKLRSCMLQYTFARDLFKLKKDIADKYIRAVLLALFVDYKHHPALIPLDSTLIKEGLVQDEIEWAEISLLVEEGMGFSASDEAVNSIDGRVTVNNLARIYRNN